MGAREGLSHHVGEGGEGGRQVGRIRESRKALRGCNVERRHGVGRDDRNSLSNSLRPRAQPRGHGKLLRHRLSRSCSSY